MSKKKKLILFVVLILILSGISGYFLLFSKKPKPTVEEIALTSEERKQLTLTEEEKKKGITLEEKEKQLVEQKESDVKRRISGKEEKKPEIKVVTINKIIDEPVKFPTLSADQRKILYFNPQTNEFYQAELDGRGLAPITRGNFVDLQDVRWSYDRSKAILSIFNKKEKNLEYFYFDFVTQESKKIDSRFKNVVISPDGQKIAYIYSEPEKNIFNLSIADPDGKNWRKVSFLNGNEGELRWLIDGKITFIPKGNSVNESSLYVYDAAEGKNSFVFTSKKYSFDAIFSFDGKKVLWQEGEKRGARPVLYTSEFAANTSAIKLSFNGLAKKCAWFYDNINVLCAVPENFSNYFRQPESWVSGEFVSRDGFYKVNTQTNETIRIAEAQQFNKDYDVSWPFMLPDGKTMYFVRKNDEKLYQLLMP